MTWAPSRSPGPAGRRCGVGSPGGQTPERLAAAQAQFARRGWLLIVIGRLVPAGRIPVLLAAGAVGYPWRRLVPAATLACLVWAAAYAVLGVVSGGLFADPLLATLLAALLILLVIPVATLVVRRRERARPGQSGRVADDGGRVVRRAALRRAERRDLGHPETSTEHVELSEKAG